MHFVFDSTISADTLIALILGVATILISVFGGIHSILTSTKKYELTEKYRAELLVWYQSTVDVMIRIIHEIEYDNFTHDPVIKSSLLARLSSQIEVGRFYFPNVIANHTFGKEKGLAYQGYRNIILEFLVHFYNLVICDSSSVCIEKLWDIEQQFTSHIFQAIDPRNRVKDLGKYTSISLPEGISIQEYLKLHSNTPDLP